jgi:hypothetical protein
MNMMISITFTDSATATAVYQMGWLQTFVLEVLGKNLGWNTGYSKVSGVIPQSAYANDSSALMRL